MEGIGKNWHNLLTKFNNPPLAAIDYSVNAKHFQVD
jgi:hypothetical protein